MSGLSKLWEQLENAQPSFSSEHDRIIYLGDMQDAYPRLLVLDKDLSPTEKILWMYLRLFVEVDHKSKPCPTYDDMMRNLNIGSRETISNALLVLRGTRWVSIIGPRRDFKNRITANLYALHSEPVTPSDVLELDDHYLKVLDKMQRHRSTKIRNLGQRLDEGMRHFLIHQSDCYSSLDQIQTRLEAHESIIYSDIKSDNCFFMRQVNDDNPVCLVTSTDGHELKTDPSTKIELGPNSLVRKSNLDSNLGKKPESTPSKYDNRTTISSSSGNNINTTTTEIREKSTPGDNSIINQDNCSSGHTVTSHHSSSSGHTVTSQASRSGGHTVASQDGFLQNGGSAPTRPVAPRSGGQPPTQSVTSRSGGRSPTQPSALKSGGSAPNQSQELHFHDADIHLTDNEKKLLLKMLFQIDKADRQKMIDEIVGQVVEKRGTPYQIRNTIAFSGTLIKLYLNGTPSWSSSSEVMAKKYHDDTSVHSNETIQKQQREAALARQAAFDANREKLKQWEAELKAKKQNATKQQDKNLSSTARSPLNKKGLP